MKRDIIWGDLNSILIKGHSHVPVIYGIHHGVFSPLALAWVFNPIFNGDS